VGSEFWGGLIQWIEEVLLKKYANISAVDMNLIQIVDTEDEVVDALNSFYKKFNLSPNF
jgi:predicted Rossmann-fold nucleotide-binding protein